MDVLCSKYLLRPKVHWRSKLLFLIGVLFFCCLNLNLAIAQNFNPSDVSGLSVWLKADSITGISNEDAFGFWGDSSASTNDFSQSTASKKPTYISSSSELNSKPVVRFDGVDDVLTSNDTFSFDDFAAFVVYQDGDKGGNDTFTKLLLHFDNNFTDSSASNHTVTNQTNVTFQSSPNSPHNTDSDIANFNASHYISVADSDDWYLEDEDFTIDFWIRFNTISGTRSHNFVSQYTSGSSYVNMVYEESSDRLTWQAPGLASPIVAATFNPVAAQWYHIALVRDGNNYEFFIDGVSQATGTNSGTYPNHTGPLRIGYLFGYLNAKMEEFRFSKGIARYTADFTAPAEPYTGSNTNFERLVDHKLDDGFWLGRDGEQASSWGGGIQEAESPNGIFVPVDDSEPHILFSERKDTVHDLFGDGLVLARNEVSTTSTSTNDIGIGGLYSGLVGDNLGGDIAEVIIYNRALTDEEQSLIEEYLSDKYDIPINAGVGTSEPQTKLAVNGSIQTIPRREAICDAEREGSFYYDKDDKRFLGCDGTNWIDFISGASGSGNDSFTKLLLHFDGNFSDSSDSNHTVTEQSNVPLLSSPDSPHNTDSNIANFNGGNILSIADSDDWNLGSEDFTIDFWIRFNSISGSGSHDFVGQSTDGSNYMNMVYEESTDKLSWQVPGVKSPMIKVDFDPVVDEWYHIALVRNGSNYEFFIDGVSQGTDTNSQSYPNYTGALRIGQLFNFLDGKMEEFRFTKGVARYTADFTPPTEPYN